MVKLIMPMRKTLSVRVILLLRRVKSLGKWSLVMERSLVCPRLRLTGIHSILQFTPTRMTEVTTPRAEGLR